MEKKRKLFESYLFDTFFNTFNGPLSIALSYLNYREVVHRFGLTSKTCNSYAKFSLHNRNLSLTPKEFTNLFKTNRIIYFILNRIFDPSAYDNYAIRWASRYGHVEVVKLLLMDKRVDPSTHGNYAIRIASDQGYVEVVKLLLQDKRVDPSTHGNYAIRTASSNGYVEVVKLLLMDKRVDPSARDNYAIRMASIYGHVGIVKLLLQDERVDPLW